MPIYRYENRNVALNDMQRKVGGSPTISTYGPNVYVDISATAPNKPDLDEYMVTMGYSYISQDPSDTPTEASAVTLPDASTSTAGLLTAADKLKLDGIASGAQVVNFTNVASALGLGNADGYIFRADGAGSGVMVPNIQDIPRRFTVGLSGDVNYTSIKAACDAAIAIGVSTTNLFAILVNPGSYTEDPFTVVPGLIISSTAGIGGGVTVTAANATVDLVTMTGGYIVGLSFRGVTSSGKALIKSSNPAALSSLFYVGFQKCAIGWLISGGAPGAGSILSSNIVSTGVEVTESVIRVTGAGSRLSMLGGFFSVPSALLPAYAVNPIQNCITVTSGAKADISSAAFIIAPKNSTQVNVFADDGASVNLFTGIFTDGYTGVKIGSVGANTAVVLQGGVFEGHEINFDITSSTGKVFAMISSDTDLVNTVSGGIFTGIIQHRNDNHTNLVGNVVYRFEGGTKSSIGEFLHTNASSGVISGGAVTVGTGLAVNVASGGGWHHHHGPSEASNCTWTSATNLSLTASNTNYVYISGTTYLPTASTSTPADNDVLLATVVTSGSAIRFLHDTRNFVSYPFQRLYNYLLDTRKFALKSGLVISQGTTNRNIDISSGIYYRATSEISYAGVSDATFSYFYDFGNTEVASQTLLSNTQYDSAGTLTTLTDGYYRADTVFLTSDGKISIIYGTTQYALQADAEANSAATAFTAIEPSAFKLAKVIVQKNAGIVSIIDLRPSTELSGGGGGGGGVTDHGNLTGLSDDDHTQYLLVSGTRAMSGDLDMGTQAITNVGLVDGVDISAHASRHLPGGVDALTTAAPVVILAGAAQSAGTAASFSRSDHQHGVNSAAPSTIGVANSEGTAQTVSRTDHVHDHGSQTSGTLHAAVTTSVNGFMSASDKTKLDGIAASATNTPLTNTAPVNVTKATAAVGVSTEAARSDHKHDITTAAAIANPPGTANAEGTATSLARSDHTHAMHSYGSSAGTICQGDDSRLSDDRTASGLRTATTVVSISGATAPTTGQILTATSSTNATWQNAGAAGNVYKQSKFAEVTADTTTTSTTFVGLLSINITTDDGYLIIHSASSSSCSSANRQIFFQVLVDSVAKRGYAVRLSGANNAEGSAVVIRVPVTAGAHTVALQWRVSASTGQVRPVSFIEESASLLVEEVSS